MWRLNILDKNKETEYYDLLFSKVKAKRDAISDVDVRNYLTDNRLKKILLAKPNELYNVWKPKLERKFNGKENTAEQIFDYKSFISNDKDISYKIAKLIGVNTCVYCNRQYIFTVDENENHIVRPDFDHYLPHSVYPFFALSLYNLIPSCPVCNRTLKGTKTLDESMNPYQTKKEDYFTFTYHINEKGFPASVQIKDRKKLDKKAEQLLDVFKIQEIYNEHTDLELTELYTFATKYSNTYLQNVLSQTATNLKLSQEEAYRILFGTELLADKNNNRPLSKFKRDILKELKVI